jgi:tetratricopeptide (TPR) repeat protein
MRTHLKAGLASAALAASAAAYAAPVPRQGPLSGRIVAAKGGETAVLVPAPAARAAEVRQDLKAGDVLRTNAAGTLAVLFADRTQVRLGRNTVLLVKQVAGGSPSSVQLQRGSLWARSPRGRSNLSVETPSATAAIRGTEYAIVAEEERTSLTVIEGVVDFFNPQGSVQVTEGQAAAARLGEAPTRIFTVNAKSREQMLYYMALQDGLSYIRPSRGSQREARAEVGRVRAVPPASRTAEDWLSFAENGAEVERRSQVREATARARALGLNPQQEARALLVEAGDAAKSKQFGRALELYERAFPLLEGRQREVARYGAFIARTLAYPAQAGQVPVPQLDPENPASYVGQAFIAAFLGDFDRARTIATQGLARFPDEGALYSMKSGIGVLTGEETEISAAAAEALKVDPDDPFAITMQSEVALKYKGDPDAAIASARRAVELAPGESDYWNSLAQALLERDYKRETEQAMREGIAENPSSLVLRSNYAITLLQQGRVDEARAQLDAAEQLDPDNAVVHLVRGFYHLTIGRRDRALEDGLAASAANPSYAEAQMLLAEIHYANGDYDLARQQLDAADRADPNSPYVPLYRAAFAIDHYRADEAIKGAREALRRYRARGGVYSSLSESKGTGSYVAGAFRFLNLDEWGRYHGDRTFDPFVSASLFDRALAAVPSPYLSNQSYLPFNPQSGGAGAAISDVFQGLRLDPLSIAGSSRDLHLTRQKFLEGIVAPGILATRDDIYFSPAASFSGTLFDPVPLSFTLSAAQSRLAGPIGTNNGSRTESVSAFLGFNPAPYDHVILYAAYDRERDEFPGTVTAPRDNGRMEGDSITAIGLYAHEFGRESILTLGGGILTGDRYLVREDKAFFADLPLLFDVRYTERSESETWFGFANYTIGLGDLELSGGLDYLTSHNPQYYARRLSYPRLGEQTDDLGFTSETEQYRFYIDGRYVPANGLELQAQVARARSRSDGAGEARTDLSLGIAYEPFAGHWLRAAYIDATTLNMPVTMAPTRVVSLRPNDAPTGAGGSAESIVARWDAEWTPHIFTSVEYQHQRFDALSFGRPNFIQPIPNLATEFFHGSQSIDVGRSSLDRISVTGNFWLTGNLGVNAVYSYSDSRVEEARGTSGAIPFLPKHFAQAGITWTHPSRIKLNAYAAYVGSRRTELNGARDGDHLTANAELEWQFSDKRFQLNAGLYNMFDADVELTPDVPNYGRTLALTLQARF